MENECDLNNSIILAISVPKISNSDGDLARRGSDKNKLGHFLDHPVSKSPVIQ